MRREMCQEGQAAGLLPSCERHIGNTWAGETPRGRRALAVLGSGSRSARAPCCGLGQAKPLRCSQRSGRSRPSQQGVSAAQLQHRRRESAERVEQPSASSRHALLFLLPPCLGQGRAPFLPPSGLSGDTKPADPELGWELGARLPPHPPTGTGLQLLLPSCQPAARPAPLAPGR